MAKRRRKIDVESQKAPETLFCCASGDELAEAIRQALANREQVVMVRVNDELLKHLDMLVEAGICRSRSSAATFMIREGIKANQPLFARIAEAAEQIATLRAQLRRLVGVPEEEEEEP
jgi:Arc/MetJ-type ribon-helix-helix transcriptional regulator